MDVQHLIVTLNSKDPEALVAFYRDVVGLTPADDGPPGSFMVGSSAMFSFLVEGHSEVSASTQEPQRTYLNLAVGDIAAEEARLRAQGVPFPAGAYEEPGVGWFATFTDPDGNYVQLVQFTG
jgi:predicted enzyme related to lactoylglutathione lyase